MNNNRVKGTAFERKLCCILAGCSFWAHNLAQNSKGQPFDVIAAKNGTSYPIDCKICEDNTFRLSRVEENQYNAMSLWRDMGNGEGWFALKLNNGAIYMISFSHIEMAIVSGKNSFRESEIRVLGKPLREWVEQCA